MHICPALSSPNDETRTVQGLKNSLSPQQDPRHSSVRGGLWEKVVPGRLKDSCLLARSDVPSKSTW